MNLQRRGRVANEIRTKAAKGQRRQTNDHGIFLRLSTGSSLVCEPKLILREAETAFKRRSATQHKRVSLRRRWTIYQINRWVGLVPGLVNYGCRRFSVQAGRTTFWTAEAVMEVVQGLSSGRQLAIWDSLATYITCKFTSLFMSTGSTTIYK